MRKLVDMIVIRKRSKWSIIQKILYRALNRLYGNK